MELSFEIKCVLVQHTFQYSIFGYLYIVVYSLFKQLLLLLAILQVSRIPSARRFYKFYAPVLSTVNHELCT